MFDAVPNEVLLAKMGLASFESRVAALERGRHHTLHAYDIIPGPGRHGCVALIVDVGGAVQGGRKHINFASPLRGATAREGMVFQLGGHWFHIRRVDATGVIIERALVTEAGLCQQAWLLTYGSEFWMDDEGLCAVAHDGIVDSGCCLKRSIFQGQISGAS